MQWIDRLNEYIGRTVAWLSLALVLLVFFNVILRYVFNSPVAWSKELEWHLFALLFLFGAGYTLLHDKHVRVDLFYDQMTSQNQGTVNFWGTLLFLLPWCIVLVYTGWSMATDAHAIGERSPEANGLPNLWLIQYAIPIGITLLFLQGVSLLTKSYQKMQLHEDDLDTQTISNEGIDHMGHES